MVQEGLTFILFCFKGCQWKSSDVIHIFEPTLFKAFPQFPQGRSRAEQGYLASLPTSMGGEKFVQRVSVRGWEYWFSDSTSKQLSTMSWNRVRGHWLTFSIYTTTYLLPVTRKKPFPSTEVEFRNLPWAQSHLAPQPGLRPMCVQYRGIHVEDS